MLLRCFFILLAVCVCVWEKLRKKQEYGRTPFLFFSCFSLAFLLLFSYFSLAFLLQHQGEMDGYTFSLGVVRAKKSFLFVVEQ